MIGGDRKGIRVQNTPSRQNICIVARDDGFGVDEVLENGILLERFATGTDD